MAQKRMFSLQVTDTDRFLDMSASAQALYFHLGMHGVYSNIVNLIKLHGYDIQYSRNQTVVL
jgi:hypothetical protein